LASLLTVFLNTSIYCTLLSTNESRLLLFFSLTGYNFVIYKWIYFIFRHDNPHVYQTQIDTDSCYWPWPIEFSLIIGINIIGCNLVSNKWIIVLLGNKIIGQYLLKGWTDPYLELLMTLTVLGQIRLNCHILLLLYGFYLYLDKKRLVAKNKCWMI
jgi:hypothetical protein